MTELNTNSKLGYNIKLNSLNSNSRNSLGLNIIIRKDALGNVISKKKKNHRVCFSDQIENGRDLVDLKYVQSFKNYNRANIGNEWSCIIF
jgi:hypothetical protein